MNVTVIGSGSFIAQALQRCNASAGWRYLSHTNALADTAWVRTSDVVINCAFDDRLRSSEYRPEWDVDLQLALLVRSQAQTRYVLLSSRTVYGTGFSEGRLHESLRPAPQSLYAKAKWQTEKSLAQTLGERLTIFRLSNVFGYENTPGRKNFVAIALRTLRDEGRIVLDINPFVERDFLPVEHCAAWLATAVQRLRGGTFHLGAGYGTAVGRMAQWIIEGHGSGELLVTDLRDFDAFWLDMGHTREAFGPLHLSPVQLQTACRRAGLRLSDASRATLSGAH